MCSAASAARSSAPAARPSKSDHLAPSVAWLAFLPIPIVLWGSFRFQRRIAPRYTEVRDRAGDLNSELAGHIGGIATIKSFTAEDREAARIEAGSDRYRHANSLAIRLSSVSWML